MEEAQPIKNWPHAPVHKLGTDGVFMITGATIYKQHFFKDPEALDLLENTLLMLAEQTGWLLEAWAVFSNHYHFVARSEADAQNLKDLINHLHSQTARELNKMANKPGRVVWFNYWDTKLTYQKSYMARLNYVHQNPVKHELVFVANRYRWCSAAWLERTASQATVQTIYGFKTDQLNIKDDF